MTESVISQAFQAVLTYCQASILQTEQLINESNIELFNLLQANSMNPMKEILDKAHSTLSLKRKHDVFHAISHETQTIMNQKSYDPFGNNSAVHYETLLWLLLKFKNHHQITQNLRTALQTSYGSQTLSYLEQFNNINLDHLKKKFDVEITKDLIFKHLSHIQSLYMPTRVQIDQGTHHIEPESPSEPPMYSRRRPLQAIYTNIKKVFGSKKERNTKPGSAKTAVQTGGLVVLNDGEGSSCTTGSAAIYSLHERLAFLDNEETQEVSSVKGINKENLAFYDEKEAELSKNNQKFKDEEFPAGVSSLTNSMKEFPAAKVIKWRRVTELFPGKEITLCSDQVGPNDIVQGYLGDCYLLSALSVLSERKDYIKRLFYSKEISRSGIYSVWLCDSGEWKNMIIDDEIPCVQGKDSIHKPCFSSSKSTDIWILLLEKAFAKLYRNYYNIDGGYQSEALSALTGAPTRYFSQKDNGIPGIEQVWLFIVGNLQNRFIVTAASRSESQTVDNKNKGIVSNHAYAILDAKEVDLGNGEKERLIKMRNPWGNYAWKGDWAEASPTWTPEIRRYLNFEAGDDGIFWISLGDFDRHFGAICSCEIHDDFRFSFIKLSAQEKKSFFLTKMTMKDSGFVYLSLQQKMKKHFRKNMDYEYSFMRVFVSRLDNDGKIESVVSGKYKASQNIVIRKNLPKGEYLITVEVDWVQEANNEVNLLAYSKASVEFCEEDDRKYDQRELYEEIMKGYFEANGGGKDKKIRRRRLENSQVYKYKLEKFGFVALFYKNIEKGMVLYNRITVQNLINMEIFGENNKQKGVDVEIKGGEEKVVLLKAKVVDVKNTSYAYQYSEIYKFREELTREQLRYICKQRGQKVMELCKGNIEVYNCKYYGGFVDLYVNKGTKGFLGGKRVSKEVVVFDCENVRVNGKENVKELEVVLGPGEEFLVDMRIIDLFESSKCERKLVI